jgi:hypothetical protein
MAGLNIAAKLKSEIQKQMLSAKGFAGQCGDER